MVDEPTKKARSAQLHALAESGQKRYASRFIGATSSLMGECHGVYA
ncbi:MAG: hypothetical protein SH821_11755 [Phototrophicales bacterium]|nr:hypothetical protein [Phototrophicales bacterium]